MDTSARYTSLDFTHKMHDKDRKTNPTFRLITFIDGKDITIDIPQSRMYKVDTKWGVSYSSMYHDTEPHLFVIP